MFPETIISIREDDFKSVFPREYEWSELYVTERTKDDIITSLGGYNDYEDDYLKFDNEYQRREEIKL